MENIKVEPRVPLGPDVSEDIARFGLKVKTKDIDSLVEEASNMVKTKDSLVEERGNRVKTKDIDSLVKETSSVTQWRSIR